MDTRFLHAVGHRPYPLPRAPWVMAQQWHDLLFAHWTVSAERMRELVPAQFPLDLYDGRCYLGIVPFTMKHVRPRLAPSVPWLSFFHELNVRTYVTVGGKPGVFFFSLDAANPIAVQIARTGFKLPYFNARMMLKRQGDTIYYDSRRTHRGAPPAELRGHYRPTGPVYLSTPGTLEHWLTERYALYTLDAQGRILRGDIHHEQWSLQPAEAEFTVNTLAQAAGFEISGPPTLHFARAIQVVVWPLTTAP